MFFDNNSPTEIPSRGTFLPQSGSFLPQLGSFLPQSGSFLPRHGSLPIHFSNVRACACRARALFKKMLSPSTAARKSRVQRASGGDAPSKTFHKRFTVLSPSIRQLFSAVSHPGVKAMWNVWRPSRPRETPANPYLQGISVASVKGETFFLKTTLWPKFDNKKVALSWGKAK